MCRRCPSSEGELRDGESKGSCAESDANGVKADPLTNERIGLCGRGNWVTNLVSAVKQRAVRKQDEPLASRSIFCMRLLSGMIATPVNPTMPIVRAEATPRMGCGRRPWRNEGKAESVALLSHIAASSQRTLRYLATVLAGR